MPCNTVLAAIGGAGYSSCNKMVFKPFYQETVLSPIAHPLQGNLPSSPLKRGRGGAVHLPIAPFLKKSTHMEQMS
jgi:hypothetical protein